MIFSELFPVTSELKLEYVVATIDVKGSKLFLDKTQVDEYPLQIINELDGEGAHPTDKMEWNTEC